MKIKAVKTPPIGPGASWHSHQGERRCQLERRIHPVAPVRLAGRPDESGVPVVVPGCVR
jgi:hypothetical protein